MKLIKIYIWNDCIAILRSVCVARGQLRGFGGFSFSKLKSFVAYVFKKNAYNVNAKGTEGSRICACSLVRALSSNDIFTTASVQQSSCLSGSSWCWLSYVHAAEQMHHGYALFPLHGHDHERAERRLYAGEVSHDYVMRSQPDGEDLLSRH